MNDKLPQVDKNDFVNEIITSIILGIICGILLAFTFHSIGIFQFNKTYNSLANTKEENIPNKKINNDYQPRKYHSSKTTQKPINIVKKQEKNKYIQNVASNNKDNMINWNSYMTELQHRIKQNWDPPKETQDKVVKVMFRISKDGRLLASKITQSSGITEADIAAVDAIKLAAPFRHLPSEFTGESVDIVFTFDYHKVDKSYGKQQIRAVDDKGNKVIVTPHYNSYAERNNNVTEKVVVIYDKNAPGDYYGARYTLYKPIGKYVGYHRQQQPSPNGYGYEPVWDGGPGSQTPCFRTIDEARHYYYPQWY